MKSTRRWPRFLAVAALIGACSTAAVSVTASAKSQGCVQRTLVITAMPLELNPLVAKATLDPSQTVRVNDRTFYVGRLSGVDVVLAMSGIGLVNAEQTTTAAFDHFSCAFKAVVFSGVAGSRYNIGDVAVPKRWTRDGTAWTGVDPKMLKLASTLQGTTVPLAQDVPVGDAACLCPGVDAPTPVHLAQKPAVHVGGDGISADSFGDHAVPCVPGGGDIAGCKPCITYPGLDNDTTAFAAHAPSLVADPTFWQALFGTNTATTADYDSQDEETAAVAEVAAAHGVPFLGVRAVSDGHGDPLGLPGFPFQFFVYRQLAGNNAATVTMTFLQLWASKGQPTG